ncbi:YceI family protein [Chitinophaga horti]|uniref:YceI family protein n=1 Tax=Chitinophaga horti TaxID=2920382 RepID=A0ABY6J3D0_9BACT|nr:YceI family protein [Chitinophaga horti]UYQ93142.1 YceI family protein [Chitinophaga horti]
MATWKIDASHSEIEFKVKHLMITNVNGFFTDYDATVEAANDDFTDAKITFEAKVDSINTKNEQRDGHLKSDDFFNAAEFPVIKFESTSIVKKDNEHYKLNGNLTIRDNTKPVELDVEYAGVTVDPWGQTKAGFELSGKISRKEFGLKWTATTEAGGIVVSDDVKLLANVQLIKQA